ncbi:MAG: DUF1289 domain-containing protein [Gammaproteobacteria bacterium]|nr:DUF1289 domain-containing protein [Gammaproteobacteria bacterium]
MTPTEDHARLTSPCVRVCALDERNVCIGCRRTLDEIVHWEAMGDAARRRVLVRIADETRDVKGSYRSA